MSSEIQLQYVTAKTLYALIRNATGQVWQTTTSTFVTYVSANYANYTVALAEQGTSGYYAGNFPTAIVAGVYSLVVKAQIGGSVAELDQTAGAGDFQWDGANPLPLSNLATSGQIGQLSPLRLARGVQILNYPIQLRSSADHISPLISGVISGQIAKDGGAFAALQSGAFTEAGHGAFWLQALTSGDLSASTIMLLFTGTGVSGGVSDPLFQPIVTQRVSGF